MIWRWIASDSKSRFDLSKDAGSNFVAGHATIYKRRIDCLLVDNCVASILGGVVLLCESYLHLTFRFVFIRFPIIEVFRFKRCAVGSVMSNLRNCGKSIHEFATTVKRKSIRKHFAVRRKHRLFSIELLESRRVLNGDFVFAKKMGGTSQDIGYSIITDEAGNVYTSGAFSGTADFDPGVGTFNLTSVGANDIFVSKLDSVGNFVWAKSFGGSSHDFSFGITVDGLGNVYSTGYFQNTVDFDPGAGTSNLTSAGSVDVFVSKLDGDGNFVWAKAFGGTGWDDSDQVVVDALGNVYTTGRFSATADFDPGVGTFNLISAGDYDVFISVLDTAGNFVGATRFGGSGYDLALGIAVDASGSIYTAGAFRSTVDFDPGPGSFNLTSAGDLDAFISKLDSAGNFVWAKAFGGTALNEIQAIEIDQMGNIYTTGEFFGVVDFDPGVGTLNLSSTGSADAFVSKLDNSGNFVWAKSFGGTNTDNGYSIAVDDLGNVYTTGIFRDTADFDPDASAYNLTSAGLDDAFISKLDSNGSVVWAKRIGGTGTETGHAITLDGLGNVYTTGRFWGTVDFDPGTGVFNLASAGNWDVFISKLSHEKDFVVTAPATGAADWILRRSGNNIQVFNKQTNSIVSQRATGDVLGVQINGRASVIDSLTIDYQFGGFFNLPYGIRFDGSTGADVLKIRGAGSVSMTYMPASTAAGITSFDVNGNSIQMVGVESSVVSNLLSLEVETQNSTDVLAVAAATGYGGAVASRISGTSSTVAISPLTWSNVRYVTIDTGANDGIAVGVANDTVTFVPASLDAAGMQYLTVDTGKGADSLIVNNNGDLGLPVSGGEFWFAGGAGTDRLSASGDANFLIDNLLLASSGGGRIYFDDVEQATLTGGDGNNSLNAAGFSGAAILNGGNGNDALRGGSGNDSLYGGNGNDRLFGNDGDDLLDGGANDDRLYGGNDVDSLFGGIGNDWLYGNDDDDSLDGGGNNDWLFGGDGNDSLLGGTGNDILSGQAGNDALDGQAGVDLYQFEGTNNAESLRLEFVTATTSRFVRKPRGLSTTLELDSITNDASDEVSVQALGGDDLITIDLAITMLGVVDGGDGTDSCTAPASWTKISC
jgi:Ca2+-binding RTX toxin-like protein